MPEEKLSPSQSPTRSGQQSTRVIYVLLLTHSTTPVGVLGLVSEQDTPSQPRYITQRAGVKCSDGRGKGAEKVTRLAIKSQGRKMSFTIQLLRVRRDKVGPSGSSPSSKHCQTVAVRKFISSGDLLPLYPLLPLQKWFAIFS